MQVAELRRVELDELELCLEILKIDFADDVNNATSKELVEMLANNFEIECTEEEVFLLHEPCIPTDRLDAEIHYRTLGFI